MMTFNKKNTFTLGDTVKNLDFNNRVKNIKGAGYVSNEKKPKSLANILTNALYLAYLK